MQSSSRACDETKPSCLRCLKFWGHCDGYPPPKKRARPRSGVSFVETSTRPLLPRATSNASSPAQDALITATPFESAYEHQGFRNFLSRTAPRLPGLFSSSLWDRVILQASASEPFIRDTLVAIGALSSCERKWVKDLPAGKKSTSGIEAAPQFRFALQKYGTAVNSMRKKLASYANDQSPVQGKKDRNLRLVLISCLLVVCFEVLQGNHFFALRHAISGHSILQDWLSQHAPIEETFLEPLLPFTSTTTRINANFSRICLGSPLPHLIEDDLIHAFSNLDIQIITLGDPRPPSLYSKLKHEGSHTIASMPCPFISVEQARLYWELIQRRTSHFIGAVAGQLSLRKDSHMNIDMGLGSGPIPISPESEIMFSTYDMSPTLLAEYHSYVSEITRWFTSFNPFYEKLVEGSRSWTASSLLKIHALGQQVLMHSSILSDEWSLDSCTPVFSEMVSLRQLVAQDPLYSTPNLFTFEFGLVNPIRSVSRWCREPSIRRESIALLRKLATREGVWDALTMASVSE